MGLTDRQKLILSAIIDDYIRSAEPVGSRSISKRSDVGYSPATIRNEMSDLEEMGYLEQPHTSAGRVPSHKGYRYFVDNLLKLGNISNHELEVIKMFFANKIQETEQVIQQVAVILSQLTNYTSIVLGPEIFSTTLKHMQLIPLNEETAVAIIVTNTGYVENKVVSIPENLPVHEMEKFVNLLNARLRDVPLAQMKSKLHTEIISELREHVARYQDLIAMLEKVLESDHENRIYLSGATNMLNQPEFKDVEKVKMIFDTFDETDTLVQIFSKAGEGIEVRIGAENDVEAFHNCSLITAAYTYEGKSLGTLGIIGPTRMEYSKVISLLQYLSKDLAEHLSRWYK